MTCAQMLAVLKIWFDARNKYGLDNSRNQALTLAISQLERVNEEKIVEMLYEKMSPVYYREITQAICRFIKEGK